MTPFFLSQHSLLAAHQLLKEKRGFDLGEVLGAGEWVFQQRWADLLQEVSILQAKPTGIRMRGVKRDL